MGQCAVGRRPGCSAQPAAAFGDCESGGRDGERGAAGQRAPGRKRPHLGERSRGRRGDGVRLMATGGRVVCGSPRSGRLRWRGVREKMRL